MKKLSFLTIVILLGVCVSTQAQISFGLRAGANMNNLSFSLDDIKTNNMVGFMAGPVLEVSVPIVGLGVETGLLYNMKGTKLDGAKDEVLGTFIKGETIRNHYLDIPVNLKYSLPIPMLDVHLTAGPYFSYALSGKDFKDVVGATGGLKDGDTKDFEVGLNFGIGAKFSKIGVRAQYGLGLTDVYKLPKEFVQGAIPGNNNVESSAKNRVISLMLTYYIF